MSVGRICRRPACTVDQNESVSDAAARMERERVGALVVLEGDRPVGILTDRDIALRVVASGSEAKSVQVHEVASAPMHSVREDLSVPHAAEEMRAKGLRRIPVVDAEDDLVGMCTADDLVRLAAKELMALADVATEHTPTARRPDGSAEDARTAAHYCKRVTTVPLGATALEAARRMEDDAVGSVVVVDEDGRPCGIATDRDLALRVAGRALAPEATPASEFMTGTLLCLDAGEPLERVTAAMSESGVRRIPLTQDGALLGIVSYDDVLLALGRELQAIGGAVIHAREEEQRESRARRLAARG